MSYYRSAPARGGWGGGDSLGLPMVTPVNSIDIAVRGRLGCQLLLGRMLQWVDLSPILGLVPVAVVRGWIWQPANVHVLHSPVMYSHILFNFADDVDDRSDLERHWAGPNYLTYWLICGTAPESASRSPAPSARDDPDDRSIGRDLRLLLAYGTISRSGGFFSCSCPDQSANDAWILFGIAFISNFNRKATGFPRGPSRWDVGRMALSQTRVARHRAVA